MVAHSCTQYTAKTGAKHLEGLRAKAKQARLTAWQKPCGVRRVFLPHLRRMVKVSLALLPRGSSRSLSLGRPIVCSCVLLKGAVSYLLQPVSLAPAPAGGGG